MVTQPNSNIKLIKTLKIIRVTHVCLLGAQMVLILITFANTEKVTFYIDLKDPFTFLVPLSGLNSIIIGGWICWKILKVSKGLRNIIRVLIARYISIQIVFTVSTVAFFLTGNYVFFSAACVLMTFFIRLRPNMRKLEKILEANRKRNPIYSQSLKYSRSTDSPKNILADFSKEAV